MTEDFKEETPSEAAGSDGDFEADLAHKRKSKSPGIARDHDAKRKENDDIDSTEDIAKQYKKFKAAPKYNLYSEEVYCVCRKPDRGELMVGCDGCEEWFHFKCMKINIKHQKLIHQFFCRFCQWQGKGVTRWHRKCRMPTCYNPVRKTEKSKYCSEECGLQFLRARLAGSLTLTQSDIKLVLTSCTTRADLVQMGKEFPELPEVRELDMDKLPGYIRDELTENAALKERINDILRVQELRADFLVKIHDKIKLINSKLQEKVEPSAGSDDAKKAKKKKSKLRRIDLCCFDAKIADEVPEADYERVVKLDDVYTAFQEEIDEIVSHYTEDGAENYTGSVCLTDRRKCLRHNGWLSLLNDQVWKKQAELEDLLEKLQKQSDATLRDYSIQKYEADV